MIDSHLIEYLAIYTCMAAADYESILKTTKACGFLPPIYISSFEAYGLPIATIYANIIKVDKQDVINNLPDVKISYEDFLCILGIFAQHYKEYVR